MVGYCPDLHMHSIFFPLRYTLHYEITILRNAHMNKHANELILASNSNSAGYCHYGIQQTAILCNYLSLYPDPQRNVVCVTAGPIQDLQKLWALRATVTINIKWNQFPCLCNTCLLIMPLSSD